MSLDFPFLSSSALEDVTTILRYINVSILFYSILTYLYGVMACFCGFVTNLDGDLSLWFSD